MHLINTTTADKPGNKTTITTAAAATAAKSVLNAKTTPKTCVLQRQRHQPQQHHRQQQKQEQQQHQHQPQCNDLQHNQQQCPFKKPTSYVTHTTTGTCLNTTSITTTTTTKPLPINSMLHECYQLQPKFPMHLINSYNLSFNSPAFPATIKLRQLLTMLVVGVLLLSFSFICGANAAPQSCILCDRNDLKAKDPQSTTYEEFLFEHQVTRNDAINALKALNESFYEGPIPHNSCKSVVCTKKVMKYCLGHQFINDHCWCEFGHIVEGLPFVPHICYVGEKVYTASVGSCFFYEEVKECCCAAALAKQWRHISGASSAFKVVNILQLCLLVFSVVAVQSLRILNSRL